MRDKIFVFTEQVRGNPFLEDLLEHYGKFTLHIFASLAECVMEALDHGPRLVIFDVAMASPAVLIQIGRIRTDRLHADAAVIVRAQRLDEASLARLYELEVNDILLTLLPLAKGRERIRLVYNDPKSEEVRQTHLKLGEGLMARGAGLATTEVSAALIESFRTQYGLEFTALATRGTWGLVPLDGRGFGLFCADFQGEDMNVAAQGNRLHAMVRSEGFDRADPKAAVAFISRGMANFLTPAQEGVLIYAVFDLQAGSVSACTAGPVIMLRGAAGTQGFSPLPRNRAALNGAALSTGTAPEREVDRADFRAGDMIVLECAAQRLSKEAPDRAAKSDWRTGFVEDAHQTPVDDLSAELVFSLIGARRRETEALSPLLVIRRT
jgi:hypothetical protein